MATDIEYALMAGRAYQTNRDDMNWFPVPVDEEKGVRNHCLN